MANHWWLPSALTVGLAAHIPQGDWTELTHMGVRVAFQRRQTLFRQGDAGRHVYVILAGSVKVVRCEADGGQAMLTMRTPGDVVGDMAALDGRPRSASVTAMTPLVAQLLTTEQFRRFVDRPPVAVGFTRYTLMRLREADEQRTELAVLPVRQRLARALLRLETRDGKLGNEPTVGLPQQDIAQLVGASRNAVVAELTALREAGVLITQRRRIVIQDLDALTRMACPDDDRLQRGRSHRYCTAVGRADVEPAAR
ncbi:Crp/Fnr family transcriptional regulator [Planosporangium sp. 12N6]|uniref:Crp/Fnr family transcriptional regulator n=1 Tax=Planosporangium spinosum TaxID=3402278 RepID=UPI003CF8FA49